MCKKPVGDGAKRVTTVLLDMNKINLLVNMALQREHLFMRKVAKGQAHDGIVPF
jgi:hypothetical protein